MLGPVPGGLPNVGVPDVTWSQVWPLLGTAAAMFVVILAQSAATSRAYAAKYQEQFDENVDLVGLGLANVSAGLHGHVRRQRQPDQDPDGRQRRRPEPARDALDRAGSCSSCCCSSPSRCSTCPNAVLASVVFIIGIELVDIAGMRKIFGVRTNEFVVATITATTVVVVGVEQAVILAIVVLGHRPPAPQLRAEGLGARPDDRRAPAR